MRSYREVKWALLCLCFVAACGEGGGFADAAEPLPNNPGSFRISWLLTTPAQQALTCAQANATTVLVHIVDAATGERSNVSFTCSLGLAISGALFAATYHLTFELVGAAGTIATAPPQTIVVLPNQTTQIGVVVFFVS